jgi:hypothetical protein
MLGLGRRNKIGVFGNVEAEEVHRESSPQIELVLPRELIPAMTRNHN